MSDTLNDHRARIHRSLASSEGLTAEMRVGLAFEEFDAIVEESEDPEKWVEMAQEDFLPALAESLPVPDIVRGLAALCINSDGSPSDLARWCFNLDWGWEDPGPGTKGPSLPPSRPARLRNRLWGKQAIERMLARTLEQRIAEARQALRPLDLSKPPPPLPFLVEGVLVADQPCLV